MKKISITFLALALSLLVSGMAFAIDIPQISTWTQSMGGSDTGIGDLLIGPLYDVRNLKNPDTGEGTAPGPVTTQQTLISIVNTDDVLGVIARLRFREWKRSIEVLDFDIPISCDGVWVGVVQRLPAGGALITSPVPPAGSSANRWINNPPTAGAFPSAPFPPAGLAFSTLGIESAEANKLARTEYGYFEIIGEEAVSCKMNVVDGTWTRLGAAARDVGNVLMGNTYLVRSEAGISHQYDDVAFSNFAVNPAGIWNAPTTGFPTLKNDVQGQGANPGVGGFNQLEAIMSKRDVMFQYVNDVSGAVKLSTSVVITFPTKHFHYNHGSSLFPRLANPDGPPFTGMRETLDDGPNGGEVILAFIWDRNENLLTTPSIPISPGGSTNVQILPWEVNIIGLIPLDPPPTPASRGFRDNVILPTKNASSGQTFTSGWVDIDLSPFFVSSSIADPRSAAAGGAGFTQGKLGISFSFFNNFFGPAPVPAGQVAANCGTPANPVACPGAYRGLPAMGIVMTEFATADFYGNSVPWQYDVDWGTAPVAIP